MNIIFNITSYSYFRDGLSSNDMRKRINLLDIVYSGTHNKWDRVMLLAMDQINQPWPSLILRTLEETTKYKDYRAFDRWNNLLERE